uniref:Uncharacterized protein n=1 Tax=Anguilla anguilla TaxID=7936 RepID=A0A0E9WGI4_ANGAN
MIYCYDHAKSSIQFRTQRVYSYVAPIIYCYNAINLLIRMGTYQAKAFIFFFFFSFLNFDTSFISEMEQVSFLPQRCN